MAFRLRVLTATLTQVVGGLNTRPRTGIGNSTYYQSPNTNIPLMTLETGSSNGGKSGTFTVTTTSGNYGWYATANSGAVTFTDTGTSLQGGWGLIGSNTDSNGTTWYWWRQDFPNASPSGTTFSTV